MSRAGIRAAGLSRVGRGREFDEDAFAVVPELDLYVVADGMGGHAGGEVASAIVVDALPDLLREWLAGAGTEPESQARALRAALLELSDTVRREAARWVGLAGMGATVVAALLAGGQAVIAHMGDCRAYRFRDGVLSRLTRDHSLIAVLLERGEITEEDARDHPARGRVTRYLGMQGEIGPDLSTVEVSPGDRLLLCSDGLVDAVRDGAITEVLEETEGDPGEACRRLLDAALEAEARDDVTALVADRGRGRRLRRRR